jgi:hypothetical protein
MHGFVFTGSLIIVGRDAAGIIILPYHEFSTGENVRSSTIPRVFTIPPNILSGFKDNLLLFLVETALKLVIKRGFHSILT